ncbi:MAG: hypothetical protein QXJ24_05405 [Thermoplasmatales archaeon]
MEFNELKKWYAKYISDLKREREEISTIFQEARENLSDVENEVSRLRDINEKRDIPRHEGRMNDLADLLKEYRKIKLDIKYFEELENYKKRLDQIDSILKREFETCPDCNGRGTIEIYDWVTTDIDREQISHFENCKLCNGRGKIPVKELLDP